MSGNEAGDEAGKNDVRSKRTVFMYWERCVPWIVLSFARFFRLKYIYVNVFFIQFYKNLSQQFKLVHSVGLLKCGIGGRI